MADLQKQVKDMSKALVGTLVNGSIHKVYRAKSSANTTLALAVFSTAFGVVSNVKGANGIFCGIALNTFTSFGQNFFGGGMVVPTGETMDVLTTGDIYVNMPTGTATFGQYVFVSDTDGTFSSNDASDPQAGKTLTSFRVMQVVENDGTADIVYISNTILDF